MNLCSALEGETMPKPAITYETEEQRAARLKRKEDTDGLLRQVEGREPARFHNVLQMLSWFFALYRHMESVPGIDPSRDIIQGVKVDRDERISWLGKVRGLLDALAKKQGDDKGVLLIWLHFRVPEFLGYKERNGMKAPQHTPGGVAIWELYREQGVNLSQRRAKEEFWRAVSTLEEFAYHRGWVAGRVERKAQADRVYRREPESEET